MISYFELCRYKKYEKHLQNALDLPFTDVGFIFQTRFAEKISILSQKWYNDVLLICGDI